MKPILFNTEMIIAILENRKTVTRRAIKLDLGLADTDKNDSSYLYIPDHYGDYHCAIEYCKYQVGDILYVRETFNNEETNTVLYAADKEFIDKGCKEVDGYLFMESEIRWKPSIHMPKKLARIFLKVINLRVERVQDITEMQVIKEGFSSNFDVKTNIFYPEGYFFVETWNKIYKDKGYGWEANPFVWVVEFEKIN